MRKIIEYSISTVLLITAALASVPPKDDDSRQDIQRFDRKPVIHPDYSDLVIPPNIAPLNFVVREEGCAYRVIIHSVSGEAITINSDSPRILIPINRWHDLLDKNRGNMLVADISVKTDNGKWKTFLPVTQNISHERIDKYLVYRRINPVHNHSRQMGIYQRDLESFDESAILDNGYFKGGCVNCHSFLNNRPDNMLLDIRSDKYQNSTVVVRNDSVNKIGTKFTYISWHPSGKFATYSVNMVGQFFHTTGREMRDVIDYDSFLACYYFDSQTVRVQEEFARKDRLETYPAWSPDGRYLYFSSAPKAWDSDNTKLIPNYRSSKYDLVRISYNIETDRWGQLETVLSAISTGQSNVLPRVSPDGSWLVLCMCDYGAFPVYQTSSDLYIVDLRAAEKNGSYQFVKMPINSDRSESWHCWSANSRWLVFSSKRDYGDFTRSYITCIDDSGKASRPFIVPQKDPEYYDSCLDTFSVPELIIEPVEKKGEQLAKIVRGSESPAVQMPITMATPTASASQKPGPVRKERE